MTLKMFYLLCLHLTMIHIIMLLSISEVVDEDYIKALFVSTGGTVVNFRFFQ